MPRCTLFLMVFLLCAQRAWAQQADAAVNTSSGAPRAAVALTGKPTPAAAVTPPDEPAPAASPPPAASPLDYRIFGRQIVYSPRGGDPALKSSSSLVFARSVLGLVQRGDRLFAHCVGESQVLVFDTGTTPPRPLPPIEVSAVVESIELDQDALTIALLDGRLLTYQVTSLRLTQVRQRPQPTQPLARPNITRTSYARITVLFGGIPGLISEFGGERTPIEGLWLAGGLRIANNILTLYIPAVRLYTNIGYGWHSFALGAHLSLGGGYPYPIVSAEAGLAMRFGAIDETHVRLTLSYGIGAILDLTVLVPIGQRHWLDFSLRGDGSLLYGGLALGAQHLLGRGRGFLTWGIGGAFLYPTPSALLQLGYVSRR